MAAKKRFEHWSDDQPSLFVKRLKFRLGGSRAWELLSDPMRQAFVSDEAFSVMRSQHAEDVKVAAMHELWMAMMVEAGLFEVEEPSETAAGHEKQAT